MIYAGIDVGAKVVKVVILGDGEVISRASILSGRDKAKAAEEVFLEALRKAQLVRRQVQRIGATGVGAKRVAFADEAVNEARVAAKGAISIFPSARTVVDVGAEEGRSVKCDKDGKVLDYAVNERCAAGAGSFVEAMARALEVKLEDMGPLSLQAKRAVTMNAQCAVFSESEVVSLVHAKTPREEIARAVHDAIAGRITSMVRTMGIEKDVVLIGGVALNPGFVESMKREMGMDLLVPELPEYVGALGAALAVAT